MPSSSRISVSVALATAAIAMAIAATIGAFVVSDSLLQYPLLAIATGAILFVLATMTSRGNPGVTGALRSPKRKKTLDVAIFLVITTTVLLGVTAGERVPDLVYPLTALTAGGIAARILIAERLHLAAIQVGLLVLSFRATIWGTFPVYGQDTNLHLGITGYIASTGEIPMFIESYYKNYPGAHLLGATTELITGTPTKTAFFLSVGLAHVLMLAFVYLLLVKLFDRRRVALLATLTVALSGGHLHLGTELYAQTLANALLPAFLYLFLITDDLRTLALLFLFGATVIVTHNLLPIVLVGTGVTLLVLRWVSKLFNRGDTGLKDRLKPRPVATSLSLIAVGTFYYWRVTDYLSYQVNRFKSILSIGSLSGAQEIPNDTNQGGSPNKANSEQSNTLPSDPSDSSPPSTSDPSDSGTPSNPGQSDSTPPGEVEPLAALKPVDVTELGGIPTVSVFDVTVPNVLSWAAPYLFLGIVATIAVFLIGRDLLKRRTVPNLWVIGALVLFGGFSIAFASAGTGAVGRADAAITILTAPLIGYVYGHLTNRSRNVAGKGVVVTLVAICVLAGTLSAPVAMSERTETSFEPVATSQEVSSVDFAQRYTTTTMTDGYLHTFAHNRQLRNGGRPDDVVSILFDHTRIQETRQKYRQYLKSPNHPLLYRSSFDEFYGINSPSSMNKVYSSGNTSIHTN